jgi:hypothetical protein
LPCQNARDDVEEMIHLEYFSEATVAWENTLSVLNKTRLVFLIGLSNA